MQPSVEIDVDETSGVWADGRSAHALRAAPLLREPSPRRRAALGREAYREVLARSGARSALRWCRRQSELGVGDGPAIFAFYLERLSARGWGRFSVERMDAEALSATVSLRDSIYVLEAGETASEPVCYIFEGFSSRCHAVRLRDARPPRRRDRVRRDRMRGARGRGLPLRADRPSRRLRRRPPPGHHQTLNGSDDMKTQTYAMRSSSTASSSRNGAANSSPKCRRRASPPRTAPAACGRTSPARWTTSSAGTAGSRRTATRS